MKMIGVNRVKVHLQDLIAGTYVVKLTVTDENHLTGTDTVRIHIKKGKCSKSMSYLVEC